MVDLDPQMSLTSLVLGRSFRNLQPVGGADAFFTPGRGYTGRYNCFRALGGPVLYAGGGERQKIYPAQVTAISLVSLLGSRAEGRQHFFTRAPIAVQHALQGAAPQQDGDGQGEAGQPAQVCVYGTDCV